MAEVEFLLGSNWILLPQGVQEFSNELQEHRVSATMAFDVTAASIKLKCLRSNQAKVMATCQTALDKIVRRELANGWESGKKIAKTWGPATAIDQYKMASILVFSPSEILRSSFRAAWIMPGELADRKILMAHLVPQEAVAELQKVTGSTLRASADGHVMYIGANSPQDAARVKGKLNALAEHLARPSKIDTRCETFIWAEDQQDSKVMFSYLEQGPRGYLKTFFLDRAKYDLEAETTMYGSLFENGVVISLCINGQSKPIFGPKNIVPAVPSKDRDEPFQAFPSDWTYNSKERISDKTPSAATQDLFHAGQDPVVTSWVTHLPKPEQMLPEGTQPQPEARPVYDPRQPLRVIPASVPNQVVSQPSVLPAVESSLEKTEETTELSKDIQKHPESKPRSPTPDDMKEVFSTLEMILQEVRSLPHVILEELKSIQPRIALAEKPPARYTTMNQQAKKRGARGWLAVQAQQTNQQPKPAPLIEPSLMYGISQKLMSMLGGLEMFTGDLSLKVKFGRICFTNIDDTRVYYEGSKSLDQAEAMHTQRLKNLLDKHHIDPNDCIFSNILTEKGGDANYISLMTDGSGERLWSGYKRRTVYEIVCCATTMEDKYFRFVIEVDGNDFSYRTRYLSNEACTLFVHCPKRTWDFQVTLSKSPRLGEEYKAFAKDLVDHLRVVPQSSGVPNLELSFKNGYKVGLLLARTVNVASYERTVNNNGYRNPNSLEIREVHDMMPSEVIEIENKVNVTLTQFPGVEELGQLPMWYEVSMQSETIQDAFRQNQDLELGEKVNWTPDQLMDARVFDSLVASAANMVKAIDGVGFWGDNHQDAGIHSAPEVKRNAQKNIW